MSESEKDANFAFERGFFIYSTRQIYNWSSSPFRTIEIDVGYIDGW